MHPHFVNAGHPLEDVGFVQESQEKCGKDRIPSGDGFVDYFKKSKAEGAGAEDPNSRVGQCRENNDLEEVQWGRCPANQSYCRFQHQEFGVSWLHLKYLVMTHSSYYIAFPLGFSRVT
jgi:hypothetical protein